MPPPSLVSKLKVQLKLSISRLRMIQQKDNAKAKQQRREMAHLLESGKVQSARIRVENIIRSDITTELHEILELYCELLVARAQLLEQAPIPSQSASSAAVSATASLDPALEEAVRSIVYAAPRTEVKELHAVRGYLVERFGKEVAIASMEGQGVAKRVIEKLKIETPSQELVDGYLAEIARFYGVAFKKTISTADEDDVEDAGEDQDEPSGGSLEQPLQSLPLSADRRKADQNQALTKAVTPKKLGQSPVRVMTPSPTSDNVSPRLKLPGQTSDGIASNEAKGKLQKGDDIGNIPDVDELARRFAELKR